MFGSNNKKQLDADGVEAGAVHDVAAGSEHQIEQVPLAEPPMESLSNGAHTLAAEPTAPPLNDLGIATADEPPAGSAIMTNSNSTDAVGIGILPGKTADTADKKKGEPVVQPLASNEDQLLDIKKQALQNLSPLISKLDQDRKSVV